MPRCSKELFKKARQVQMSMTRGQHGIIRVLLPGTISFHHLSFIPHLPFPVPSLSPSGKCWFVCSHISPSPHLVYRPRRPLEVRSRRGKGELIHRIMFPWITTNTHKYNDTDDHMHIFLHSVLHLSSWMIPSHIFYLCNILRQMYKQWYSLHLTED